MTHPLPTRPNVRNCTHIKVTGQQCGSPALRGEFFCEFGPPLSPCGAGALAREDKSPCSADTPVREAEANAAVQCEAPAKPLVSQQNVSHLSAAVEPAAKRRKNAAHGASRGTTIENDPAPKERKKPDREQESELKRVQAAIAGAERGN